MPDVSLDPPPLPPSVSLTPQYFFLHPVAATLFAYIMLRSAALTLWRGAVVWRGTAYPLDELRQELY